MKTFVKLFMTITILTGASSAFAKESNKISADPVAQSTEKLLRRFNGLSASFNEVISDKNLQIAQADVNDAWDNTFVVVLKNGSECNAKMYDASTGLLVSVDCFSGEKIDLYHDVNGFSTIVGQ